MPTHSALATAPTSAPTEHGPQAAPVPVEAAATPPAKKAAAAGGKGAPATKRKGGGPCIYFNTAAGCRLGDTCTWKHE
jgi:hypothetical protein